MAGYVTKTTRTSDPTVTDDIDSGYAVGSEWTNSSTGTKWLLADSTASAAVWDQIASANMTMANVAPASAQDGDLWWSTDEGALRVYYDDGDSSQWVDASASSLGDTGSKGGVRYNFDSVVTDTDPGTGGVKFDNAVLTSVTQIFINNSNIDGVNVTSWLDSFDDSTSILNGTIVFLSNHISDSTTCIFNVTGAVTDATTYRKIAVSYVSGTLPSSTEELVVLFSSTGDKGETGNTGTQGDKGGVRYDFDTTVTDADPGTGTVRFNNATFGSITDIYIDDLDVSSNDVTSWLDSFDDSTSTINGILSFVSNGNADPTIALFNVSGAVVVSSGYRTIAVTPVSGAIPSNAEELIVLFSPTGDKGDTGTTGVQGDKGGVQNTFSTTVTDADPGQGVVRFNNATIGSVTQIFVDNLDSEANDITAWLDSFDDSTSTDKGTLVFVSNTNADTTIAIFNVTGTVVDGTGYRKVPVTYLSGTLPTDAEEITTHFSRVGDKGDTGTTGSVGDKGGVRYDFSTTVTDADPGQGIVRFNNATIGSVTNIYIDNTDVGAVDFTGWLDTFDDSTTSNNRGTVTFVSNTNADTTIAKFRVTGAVVDGTGYRKVPVTYLSGTLPTDAEELIMLFSPTGDNGGVSVANAIAMAWLFGS